MQPSDNQTLSDILRGRPVAVDLDVAAANSEGVAALIHWTLSHSGKLASLPEAAQQSLATAYAVTWFQNDRMFKELEALARLFAEVGIPTVVLKGACFALTVYPDIGLRPMGDLDLLVPGDRLDDAVRIARSRGFTESLPEESPGLNAVLSHHVRLQTTDPLPLILELHDSLVADKAFTYAVPVDWFWTQTEPVFIGGERVGGERAGALPSLLMLTPEAQVLYAAAHAMLQHGGRGAPLRWFYDLHLLVTHYSGRMNWPLVISQAVTFEWISALGAALCHTQTNFGTPIPEEVWTMVARVPDRHQALVARLQTKPATRFLEEKEKLATLNWPERLRVLVALIVPTPSYMKWRYQLTSSWSVPGYYVYRWWGILVDGVRTLIRRG